MPRDKEKAIERARRYRAKKHAERYGEGAGKCADGWDHMAELAKLRAEKAAKGGDCG